MPLDLRQAFLLEELSLPPRHDTASCDSKIPDLE
jgi:hypothetical protein